VGGEAEIATSFNGRTRNDKKSLSISLYERERFFIIIILRSEVTKDLGCGW